MKLTIGIATRGRPGMLLETVRETMANVRHPETRLVVIADADDRQTVDAWKCDDDRVTLCVMERPDSVAEKWNHMVKVQPADVYLHQADDGAHVTHGFDLRILDAASLFPDGIGVIYGHMANLSFPNTQAFTSRWVALTGGLFVTHFPYWFIDHWVDDVARMVGRIAAADVIVNDRRPGTMERRDPALWATLYDALYMERRAMAERIFAAPDFICGEWQKDVLRSTWHLIEERSRALNSIVRGMTEIDHTTDERYERIKAHGIKRLMSAYHGLEKRAA
jgi:hypothetical protein